MKERIGAMTEKTKAKGAAGRLLTRCRRHWPLALAFGMMAPSMIVWPLPRLVAGVASVSATEIVGAPSSTSRVSSCGCWDSGRC